jgi:hypothetical protein
VAFFEDPEDLFLHLSPEILENKKAGNQAGDDGLGDIRPCAEVDVSEGFFGQIEEQETGQPKKAEFFTHIIYIQQRPVMIKVFVCRSPFAGRRFPSLFSIFKPDPKASPRGPEFQNRVTAMINEGCYH